MNQYTETTYTIPGRLLDAIADAIADGVAKGLKAAEESKPKRGPTPCSTCRWCYLASSVEHFNGVERCTAHRSETSNMYLGSQIAEEVLPIGCPLHEETVRLL